MKFKLFFISLLLVVISFSLFSQNNFKTFYNLKLKANKVQIYERRENKPDRITSHNIVDSYFFFTESGIYGADEFGILIYEFTSSLRYEKEYYYDKYYINATDVDLNKECTIVVYIYHDKVKYKLFVDYKTNNYIFDCEDLN